MENKILEIFKRYSVRTQESDGCYYSHIDESEWENIAMMISAINGNKRNENVSSFFINPEFPIGTEFWIMKNNKPTLGLISAINTRITSHTYDKRGLRDLLFGRWQNGKQKDIWECVYSYEAQLIDEIQNYKLFKKNNLWYIGDRRVYSSKEELKNSL